MKRAWKILDGIAWVAAACIGVVGICCLSGMLPGCNQEPEPQKLGHGMMVDDSTFGTLTATTATITTLASTTANIGTANITTTNTGAIIGNDPSLVVGGQAGDSSNGRTVSVIGGAGDGSSNDGGAVDLTGGTSGGASGVGGVAVVDGGGANGGTAGAVSIGATIAESVTVGRSGKAVTIGGNITSTVGAGAIVTNKCTNVETGNGMIHQTTLTFTLTGAHDLDMADGDHGTGIKIYDFPAGSIVILGATINGLVTSVNAEGGGATFPMALGSVVAADDNTLIGTEANIIPSTAVDGGTAKDLHATIADPIIIVAAGTNDLDLYANAAITDGVATGAVTIAWTGTATITWVNLGDY